MIIDLGYYALCLSLAMSAFAAVASAYGGYRQHPGLIRSGENAALAVFALLSLAVVTLWYAILTKDFQVQYVAENTSRAMPTHYVIASLWGGQRGSILFWGWVMSIYLAAVVALNRYRYRELMPYVVATLAVSTFFYALLNVFAADPFQRLTFTPADGRGLNPILQHPYMAIHPPMLYAGMVGMAVPFGFGVAALLSGQLDATWLRAVRRWLLIPWTFLGAGLLLGGKWAYVELGWGGYWGWDPVENASLMPWLAATALLHSIMIQERKGMLKVWNIVLLFLTYGLTVFGTFLTRSGLVSSVHSFAQSSIGTYFVVYMALALAFCLALLAARLPHLRSENHLESFASRESAFLLNNWILLGMLFAVLWGTLFPVVSEALTGDRVTVGPPFFNRINVPIGLVLLFLTGAGPLFAWRRTSGESLKRSFGLPLLAAAAAAPVLWALGAHDFYALVSLALCAFVAATIALEFYRGMAARRRGAGEGWAAALSHLLLRSRRRYGGYLVHVAVILLFVGFTGKAFTVERELVLGRGESGQVRGYTVTFQGLATREDPEKSVTAGTLQLEKDGRFLATLLPQRHAYRAVDQSTTEVAIYSTWREDFYAILVGGGADRAKFQIFLNPLVSCVWLGGILFVLSSLWTMWPSRRERDLAALDRASTRAAERAWSAGLEDRGADLGLAGGTGGAR
ncbi:MAG: heme lyase CcmF/NrfE family subunit [Gemmatimonadota bacterium]